mgnify:FL=1
MAVSVAAILKKVAVAVGSNKKVLKTVCGIVLGIVVIVCMPIIALLGIFSGDAELDIDTEPIYDRIEEGQTEFTETFDEIEEKMTEAGFSEERIEEARILYEYSLFRFSEEEDFTVRFVGCFAEEQTDEEVIAAVNAEFGTAILPEEFIGVMEDINAQKNGGETMKTEENKQQKEEERTNEIITEEDIAQQALYVASASDDCTEAEQAAAMLAMLGADIQ